MPHGAGYGMPLRSFPPPPSKLNEHTHNKQVHAAFSFGSFDCPERRSVRGWERQCRLHHYHCHSPTRRARHFCHCALCSVLPRSVACINQSLDPRTPRIGMSPAHPSHREHDTGSNSRPPKSVVTQPIPCFRTCDEAIPVIVLYDDAPCHLLCYPQFPVGQKRKLKTPCSNGKVPY